MSAIAQSNEAAAAEVDTPAAADGRLSSRHRCAQAQRRPNDLRCARHPDHGLRPHGAGRRHSRPFLSARAERRLCRLHRRLPDQETRHLSHGVGARIPERSDRASPRHHQLLPDDPDLRLIRARDRRSPAGRLRGDGPARHRQAAVQGGVPCAARRRHRHRRGARDPRRRLGPPGRRLSRSAGQAFRPGDGRRRPGRSRSSRSSTRRRRSIPRRPRSSARSMC